MGRAAQYSIEEDTKQRLVIRDIGPWDKHFTVTNDAERVVEDLWPRLGDRPLYYYDSEGELGRLLISPQGKFVGFAFAAGLDE